MEQLVLEFALEQKDAWTRGAFNLMKAEREPRFPERFLTLLDSSNLLKGLKETFSE